MDNIKYILGNLLDEANLSHAIIAHGCNAQGAMGSGVAKAIRAKFPKCFDTYKAYYDSYGLKVGNIVWYSDEDHPGLMIANAVTQEFYGTDRVQVDYDAVERVLAVLCLVASERCIPLRMPLIGAGLAGGSWDKISGYVQKYAAQHKIDVEVWVIETDKFEKLSSGGSIG